ncbi:MAG: hypothetical protein AB2A00_06545 [Myxococcota bacterium]
MAFLRALCVVATVLTVSVAEAHAAPVPVDAEADDDGNDLIERDENNPWQQYLCGPMALPWPCEACLDGYAPWGRSNAVKYLASFLTVWLGVTLVAIFPVTFIISVVGLAMAVVVAIFAVYSCITGGMRDGCFPKRSTMRRADDACGSIYSVWTWGMCLSYALCTPWLGVKLIQRGVLSAQDPIPDEGETDERKRGAEPLPPAPSEEGTPQRDVTPMRAPLAY